MTNNVFDTEAIQIRLDYLKNNPITLGTIKTLNHCICDFIKTDKGKHVIKKYIEENNCYNQELIDEIKNFKQ